MAKRFRGLMWALPWKRNGHKDYPEIADAGAWALYYTKEMAERRMLDPRQQPKKVKVIIEEEEE